MIDRYIQYIYTLLILREYDTSYIESKCIMSVSVVVVPCPFSLRVLVRINNIGNKCSATCYCTTVACCTARSYSMTRTVCGGSRVAYLWILSCGRGELNGID